MPCGFAGFFIHIIPPNIAKFIFPNKRRHRRCWNFTEPVWENNLRGLRSEEGSSVPSHPSSQEFGKQESLSVALPASLGESRAGMPRFHHGLYHWIACPLLNSPISSRDFSGLSQDFCAVFFLLLEYPGHFNKKTILPWSCLRLEKRSFINFCVIWESKKNQLALCGSRTKGVS